MNLRRPLCILCWILSLPVILALMSATLRGEETAPETLPEGLEVVSITAQPTSVELTHKFDCRQLLITGTLKTGEQVDLTRIATLSQPATKVRVTPLRRLEALADPAVTKSIKRVLAALQKELALLEKQITAHLKASPTLANEIERLCEIEGVGKLTVTIGPPA